MRAVIDAAAARPCRTLLWALAALVAWRLAALVAAAPPLQFDEAQYWFWARTPDWGYYSKPPLVAWGIAASTALFGDAMPFVRLPTLLCYPAAAAFLFLAARRLFSDHAPAARDRIALLGALAYATLPTVAFYSWAATTDGWLVLCWAAGTWALAGVLRAPRGADAWRDWLALGAAIGFGLLAKYAMLVFASSAAVVILIHRRDLLASARPWVAAALACLLFLPNLLWNARHDFQTVRHTAEISHLDGASFGVMPLLEFVASQFAVFGPILTTALVMLLVVRIRRRETRGVPGERVCESPSMSERDGDTPWSPGAGGTPDSIAILLWLGLPMLAVICVQAFLARAFANWAQAAYVPLALAVVAWLVLEGRTTLLKWSFAIHLAFAALFYHHFNLVQALDAEPPRALDLTQRLRVWPVAGVDVGALLAARPGAALVSDEREVLTEMAYYARDARPVLAAFNPERVVSDHFRLKHDLADVAATGVSRFVIVSRKLDGAALAGRFERLTPLPPLRIAVRSDRTVELRVWEAEGFVGY